MKNALGGIVMSTVRQDAWTKDEDLFLAEVVLRHIREGSTQLLAFEEVGKKLNRTPAACGFRWNSFVRKQYKSGIELAKRQRKELKKNQSYQLETPVKKSSSSNASIQSLSDCIEFLQNYQKNEEQFIQQKVAKLNDKLAELEKENKKLREENLSLKEDYHALLAIMEKARKMAIMEEDHAKVTFQMDSNGNLEKVRK